MSNPELNTSHHTTPNGQPYTGKSYKRPGFYASVIVGDPDSFLIQADELMTFYPDEVREISSAISELADWMERDG